MEDGGGRSSVGVDEWLGAERRGEAAVLAAAVDTHPVDVVFSDVVDDGEDFVLPPAELTTGRLQLLDLLGRL